jgi:uncharacterized protein
VQELLESSSADSEVAMTAVRNLALYLTESCNLACSYCFAANMERQPIDEALARDALDRLLFRSSNPAREVSVTFWGGEPLLAFDLLRSLVLYAEGRAKETGRTVRFGIPTNLTLLTETMLDFLVEHQVGISLSLDGGERAQRHRPLRGGTSSFPLVLDKLALLERRLGKRLPGVRMTVTPQTASDLVQNVSFFLDRGFRSVYFAAVAEAQWTLDDLSVYEQQQRQLATAWIESLRAGRMWLSTSWNKSLARRELRRRGAYGGEQAVMCGAGTSMLAVDIYGDIFPCHRFAFYDKAARAHALGNVRDLPPDPPAIPQLVIDPARIHPPEDGPDGPTHANAYQQVCPALNCAMCGDLHRVHSRLGALAAIEERVLDTIEGQLREEPVFQDFVEKVLLPSYRWGELSSSTIMLLSRVSSTSADTLADKADAILQRLQQQRRDLGDSKP